MNNNQSKQALEGGILNDVGLRLGKSFVTCTLLLGLTWGVPLGAAMDSPDTGRGGVAQPADAGAAVGAELERLLSLRPATTDETVALFYLGRAYRPVWNDSVRTRALIAAVEGAAAHGLAPGSFPLNALRHAGDAEPAVLSATQQAERELLLSDTLARLLRQIRYGVLDPRQLYRDWNFTPMPGPHQRATELAAVLRAEDLGAAIALQAPEPALYRALQQALVHYQARIGDDWPRVPAGVTLRPGERNPRVAALRARLQAEGGPERVHLERAGADLGATPDPAYYDEALAEAVKGFQRRHGMDDDAAVGRQTLAALNTTPAQRVEQVRANLERLRWVASDLQGDRLLVDITGYRAELRLGGETLWSARVIVGKPTRRTPSLRDKVVNLVFNPKWVVPPTILREDVIPAVARGTDYLDKHRLSIFDRDGEAVDPAEIDWSGARSGGFPYRVVQASGADGSLGRIKFSLSNPYSIYLHDTNARSLFGRSERALSSGCVRVEQPEALALLLLDNPQRWSAEALQQALDSGRTQTQRVGRDVTVLLHYTTAGLNADGTLQLRNDIYGHDRTVAAALDAAARAGTH